MDREKILNMFGGKCAYCGDTITLRTFQVDHIHAKYRGGEDKDSNYYPACRSCNASKATYTLEEFRTRLVDDVQRLRRDSSKFRILERFNLIQSKLDNVVFYFEIFTKL